jgi:ATP-dependent DNA helicase RecG
MSATPIPRTLSMILYGNFHVSAIRHLPEKRLVIKNSVVDISFREKAYQFIYKHLKEGEQAFIICPMIESSEDSNLESVMEYAKKCREIFPEEVRIGVLHGQLKSTEKNQIMEQFALGNIHLLISTTVVEVGVNVPNATVMMIENADRFGLAQLHQLRGRVGRGEKQSYCIFINTSKKDLAKKRLKVLQDSNDGFFIAEQDLKLRGPGDFFGVRQSGEMLFDLADILSDAEELTLADEISKEILEIENWQDLPEYKALALRTQQEYGKFIDFPTI